MIYKHSVCESGKIAKLEELRLELQAQCDEQRTQAERNRLGQFATPFSLAEEIVQASLPYLSDQQVYFLDPAFGTGAFYSAVLHLSPKRVVSASGYEVDPHYGLPAKKLWAETDLHLQINDFTTANINEPFANLLICNPPYVRHHHISSAGKKALGEAAHALGVKLSGLAGLYCYFMVLAHRCLMPDAVSAWLIPSEFMDVNYGDAVKSYLLSQVTLLRIHRFDPNEVQFSDALVSSAIVWFKNSLPAEANRVEISFGGTVLRPAKSSVIDNQELKAEPKWTQLLRTDRQCGDEQRVRIGDLFKIKRGLATGDNGFFILTEEQVAELGIGKAFLKPILPSPRYLKQDEIEADEHGLPMLDERLFLIDCPLQEDELMKVDPALARYLRQGKTTVAKGYLCSSRSPWYSQENRPPAPFLCTYMGRPDSNGQHTFRFIYNRSVATAANVYLLMYPKATICHRLEDVKVGRRVFELLNRIPMQTMTAEGRVYGGGLHKLEPRELANVPAEEIAAILSPMHTTRGKQIRLPVGETSARVL